MEKNKFGKQLEELLLQTNVKNANIAKALNYDVSYISKWITGKSLPSKKNIENILYVISEVLVQQSTDQIKEKLLEIYDVKNEEDLKEIIRSLLRDAFYDAIGETDERLRINNAILRSSPKGQTVSLLELSKGMKDKSNMNLIYMLDLFALDHVTKLKMAGILDHKFVFEDMRKDITLDYIINLSNLKGNSIYDVILLVHLLTCFSMTNFHIYYSDVASGKLLQVIEDEYAAITLLGANKQLLCTTTTKDRRVINEMYEGLKEYKDPDKAIFFETDMDKMILHHEYMQTIISQDARWLVGHMTEQFISPELFKELAEQTYSGKMLEEVQIAYRLSRNYMLRNHIQIIFYSLALMDFVLSGELDFFNQKIILSPEQRTRELLHIKELFQQMEQNQIKFVNEGFSEDFKYVTNPCIFLSGSLGYLRLENKKYESNILLVRDETMQNIFNEFYHEIWNGKQSEIISDFEIIMKRIDSLIETSKLLQESE